VLSVAGHGSAAPDPVPDDPCHVFQQMGEDAGLATRTVVALLQDIQGFIWIGTLDGLFRFDGVHVTRFDEDAGLPSSYILQIEEGPDGTIWVLTHAGAARSEGQGFVAVGAGEMGDQDARQPQRIAVDASRNAYVASSRGLLRIGSDGGGTRTWTQADGLPEKGVEAVHVAVDGWVWFSSGGRVGALDPSSGNIEMLPASAGVPEHNTVQAIMSDGQGRLWVRTDDHLVRREPGTSVFVHDDEGLPPASIYGMPALARDGGILVPTDCGLFFKSDGGWKSVTQDDGLPSNAVFSVLEDHEGALWLGFGGVGLVRWPGRRQWSAWTTDQGLPDNTVWQSARDPEGRLWVGTSNGVAVWDHERRSWRVLTEEDGIAGPGVWQMAVGQDGRMWTISRMGELTRYDSRTLEPEKVPVPGVDDGRMARLTAGPDRTLWVSSYEHLFTVRLHEGQMIFEPVEFPPEVSGCTKIVSVAPDGVVWTGGVAGLARFDGVAWKHFSKKDGLRLNQLDFMVAPSGSEVWFVYPDLVGVAHLRLVDGQPQIKHFGTAQGLPSNTVYSLGLDAMGRLWAGGNAGLAVMDGDGPMRVFNRNDGLIWDDLSSHSFLAEPDGSFFVGTSQGLAHFTPSGEAVSEKAPNVVITSATLGGQERIGDEDVDVGYDERTFVVKYSGLTFRDPTAVRFRYRLVGLEEEYQETALREQRYPTLPAGSYRFDVLCRSASGIWSDRPAVFEFVVRPAWWGAWWTRVCAVLLLCIAVTGVVWLRTRKLEADRRRLEAAVDERSTELARANKELEEMSYTDALTGTRNRRYFMTVIPDEIARVMRMYDDRTEDESDRNRDLVFYIVDIDWFKKVNDEYGHKAGDRVLSEVARRINSALRQSDLLVRWGGEEFLIVCRDSEPSEGSGVARRILDAVGSEPFDLGGGGKLVRSCSVGWAAFPWFSTAPDVVSFETVIELADKALYMAKESGRDRAVGVLPLAREPRAGEPASWLARPLGELENRHVRLVRDLGPTVRASAPRT